MTIIRHILATMFTAFAIATAAFAQNTSGDMLQDLAIPLMEGLTENTEEALLFDSPDGRIISAQASGAVNAQSAFDYYRVVLPSLGWGIEQDNSAGLICEGGANYCFKAVRDEEALVLSISSQGQNSVLTYSLSPN